MEENHADCMTCTTLFFIEEDYAFCMSYPHKLEPWPIINVYYFSLHTWLHDLGVLGSYMLYTMHLIDNDNNDNESFDITTSRLSHNFQ